MEVSTTIKKKSHRYSPDRAAPPLTTHHFSRHLPSLDLQREHLVLQPLVLGIQGGHTLVQGVLSSSTAGSIARSSRAPAVCGGVEVCVCGVGCIVLGVKIQKSSIRYVTQ